MAFIDSSAGGSLAGPSSATVRKRSRTGMSLDCSMRDAELIA